MYDLTVLFLIAALVVCYVVPSGPSREEKVEVIDLMPEDWQLVE